MASAGPPLPTAETAVQIFSLDTLTWRLAGESLIKHSQILMAGRVW